MDVKGSLPASVDKARRRGGMRSTGHAASPPPPSRSVLAALPPLDTAACGGAPLDSRRASAPSVAFLESSSALVTRCANALALTEAIRQWARGDEYTSTYDAAAVRIVSKDTRCGYAIALDRLVCTLQRQLGGSARPSLQDHLLQA